MSKTISALPTAMKVADTDYLIVEQPSQTVKTSVKSLLKDQGLIQEAVYDVFVTYGQSNSAGEAILSGDTSGFPAPLPTSLMYDFRDGTIKPITQNVVSSSGVASSGHAWENLRMNGIALAVAVQWRCIVAVVQLPLHSYQKVQHTTLCW